MIHSEETKKKISEALKGRSRPDLSKALKGHHHSKETRQKMSETRKGYRHSEEMKKRLSEARIAYMASGKMKRKDTSIELKIEKELKNQSIPYMKQTPVEKIGLVDFLLPNKIIIQCDGDYWHGLPKVIKRDANQDFLLGFKGYKVFRFSESEIKKSARKCILKMLRRFR
jgi:very-short-patch-repair endonuclease